MKQLSVFTLRDLSILDIMRKPETLEVFSQHAFTPCTAAQVSTIGMAPTPIDNLYMSDVNGNLYFNIVTQQKKVKKGQLVAVMEQLTNKELELHPEMVELPQDKQNAIKDAAISYVVENTFPDDPKASTVVFTKTGLVLVDAKGKKAEALLSYLRVLIGTLPVIPYETEKPVTDLLDKWVKDSFSGIITLGNKVTLIDPAAGKEVLTKCSVYESIAASRVESGCYVEECELVWDGIMQFTLSSDFTFSSLKFAKGFASEAENYGATLILVVAELLKTIAALTTAINNLK